VYAALQINSIQDDIKAFFSDEKWRLAERSDLAKSPEKRLSIAKAFSLTNALHENIMEINTTFTVLGVAITKTLFISLITAVVGALASWISSLLN